MYSTVCVTERCIVTMPLSVMVDVMRGLSEHNLDAFMPRFEPEIVHHLMRLVGSCRGHVLLHCIVLAFEVENSL